MQTFLLIGQVQGGELVPQLFFIIIIIHSSYNNFCHLINQMQHCQGETDKNSVQFAQFKINTQTYF